MMVRRLSDTLLMSAVPTTYDGEYDMKHELTSCVIRGHALQLQDLECPYHLYILA